MRPTTPMPISWAENDNIWHRCPGHFNLSAGWTSELSYGTHRNNSQAQTAARQWHALRVATAKSLPFVERLATGTRSALQPRGLAVPRTANTRLAHQRTATPISNARSRPAAIRLTCTPRAALLSCASEQTELGRKVPTTLRPRDHASMRARAIRSGVTGWSIHWNAKRKCNSRNTIG